jgi:hypothetical protein
MGSVVISGATSGAVTLAVPDEAGTRTLTLPATTGTILTNDISQAGDTSAGDDAAVGYTAGEGLILTGQGSTSDVTIKNDADQTVLSIPTGTQTVQIDATLTVGDDLSLLSDGAIMKFGADSEIVLTHVADAGLRFSDSDQLQFGTGGDLAIKHDGSNSSIKNTTGDLYIEDAGGNIYIQAKSGEQSIVAFADGAVDLYHNNAKKLETTASGVTVTGGVAGATSISGGALGGRRNAIYNPTFSVNQRFGTDANTTMNTYAMDRWRCFGGGTGAAHSWTTRSDAGEGDQHYSRFQRPADNTVTVLMGITQGLETIDCKAFAGKEVTLSFRARGGTHWSPTNGTVGFGLAGGEGTDENPVSMTNTDTVFRIDANIPQGGGFVQYSGTGTVPADKTQLSLQISWTPVGTAGAADYWDVREVQLELGDTVTQFEQRTYNEEFQLCQRYCSVYSSASGHVMPVRTAQVDSANRPEYTLHYPEKRANPSITVTDPTNLKVLTAANTGIAVAGFSGALVGTARNGANLFFTVSSGVTTNDLSGICLELIVFQNSASITVDAEL